MINAPASSANLRCTAILSGGTEGCIVFIACTRSVPCTHIHTCEYAKQAVFGKCQRSPRVIRAVTQRQLHAISGGPCDSSSPISVQLFSIAAASHGEQGVPVLIGLHPSSFPRNEDCIWNNPESSVQMVSIVVSDELKSG